MPVHKMLLETILLVSYLTYQVDSAQIADVFIKRQKPKYTIDLTGCGVLEKQCSHLDEELALLSCCLNTAHNNKTTLSAVCQHRIWMHQAEVLDNNFLAYKLQEPCQEESMILSCLRSGSGIDCLLKKKPSVRDRICWRTINKLESQIFNDWQITSKFTKLCFTDIQGYSCGRIPVDTKALSQTETLRCLLNNDNLRPECQAEVLALKDMKYTSLQLDKVVFAACSAEQKKFCPNEIAGSWLLYKCLLTHKYDSGNYKNFNFTILLFI